MPKVKTLLFSLSKFRPHHSPPLPPLHSSLSSDLNPTPTKLASQCIKDSSFLLPSPSTLTSLLSPMTTSKTPPPTPLSSPPKTPPLPPASIGKTSATSTAITTSARGAPSPSLTNSTSKFSDSSDEDQLYFSGVRNMISAASIGYPDAVDNAAAEIVPVVVAGYPDASAPSSFSPPPFPSMP